jgi:hypothetical protein
MDMLKLTTRYTPDEFNEFLEKVREKMEESKHIEPLRDHYDDDSAEPESLQALRLTLLILTYPEHTEPDAGIMAEDENLDSILNAIKRQYETFYENIHIFQQGLYESACIVTLCNLWDSIHRSELQGTDYEKDVQAITALALNAIFANKAQNFQPPEAESIRAKLNIGSLLIERLSPLLDVDNLPPGIWQNLSWASAFIGGLCALEIQLLNQTQTEGSSLFQDNNLNQQQTMPLYSFIRSLERTKPTQPTEQGLHRALHLVKTSMPSLSEETFSLIEQARIPRRGEIDSIHNPPPIDNT